MENCNKYQEWVSAFIDGMLPEAERLELMEHMASCPGCQAYFDDQIAIHDALTGLDTAPPADFARQVMARVRETRQDAAEKKVIPFPHWRRWAATAACCAVAILGIWAMGGEDILRTDSQSLISYDMPRAQDEPAVMDDAANGDAGHAPAEQGWSTACDTATCFLEDDTADTQAAAASPAQDLARAEEDAAAEEKAIQCTVTLTTASPVAARWVQEHLEKDWQSGCGYELTAEQFDEVRELLDAAEEAYTLEPAEKGASWYLILAE